MKNASECPKCESDDIIRIPGRAGAHGAGNNITTGLTIFSAIMVTRYLCASCGYSEEWIDSSEDIDRLRPMHRQATGRDSRA
ncbi:MAG: putative nucleic-acid-binding Zn-ribbon protein [Planctomycetota bacterium]|jgi:predicted nucleic-acid-binding Zn-ribbon protein